MSESTGVVQSTEEIFEVMVPRGDDFVEEVLESVSSPDSRKPANSSLARSGAVLITGGAVQVGRSSLSGGTFGAAFSASTVSTAKASGIGAL